ncbi:MAG: PAS domain S-box protein [Candidatus Margulisiibacteriota bacterium]
MADLKLIEINEAQEKAHSVIFLRYIALTITVFAGTTWAILAGEFPQFISFGLSLAGFVLLYNLAGHLYLKRKEASLSPRKVVFLCFFQLLADVAAITFLLHVTGGILSPFIIMYFFPILIISMVYPEGTIFATLLSFFVILLYEALLYLEFNQIFLPFSVIKQGGEVYRDFNLTLYYMIVLPGAIVIAAFLANILAKYLTKGEKALKRRVVELNKFRIRLGKILAERRQAEETLRESEERYRDLFENANDLIQSVDINGKFIYVNRKWLETLGYTENEAKRLTFKDILRQDQIPLCMETFKKIRQGETINRVETVFASKNGKEICVEGNINAKFKDGKFVASRGIFRDISEHKQTEDKLKGKMEELEEFRDLAVGRELKMIELEKEVNGLLAELGREPKHKES